MSEKDEIQINRIMNGLKCTREQAIAIHETDKEINRGQAHEFDLPPEVEKQAKKLCNSTTKNRTKSTTPRTYKSNATKASIIEELRNYLTTAGYADLVVVNAERQLTFKVDGKTFDLTLIQKRKTKDT